MLTKRPGLVLVELTALLVVRLVLHILLYRAGFESVTADEFGRTVVAARWSQSPHLVWSGVWLPFYTYLVGLALRLRWDLVWVPRAVSLLLGLASIVVVYWLTASLFQSSQAAFLSAALLAVNPAHVWLSATPLTEIPYTALVLAAVAALVRYADTDARKWLGFSAFLLLLANGFRFEGWAVSAVFSLLVVADEYAHLRRDRSGWRHCFGSLSIAGIPWAFPLAWIVGSSLQTGDPLYFLHTIQSYKSTWYGGGGSYLAYLQTLLRIDPYATVIGAAGVIACAVLYRRRKPLRWYVLMAVVPFVVFVYLHGAQIEPPGNYLRYLAPFLFTVYPIVGGVTETVIWRVTRSQIATRVLLALICGGIAVSQSYTTSHYANDPAAGGVKVGQWIRLLRGQQPGTSHAPVLIELSYWQYLAIHVGASDVSHILYDRSLDLERRASRSILYSDEAVIRSSLARCSVGYVVVKSEDLKHIVQRVLRVTPSAEVNGYAFYAVSDDLDSTTDDPVCPLVPGTGY